MEDDLSIPDFLKIDAETRREAWRGVRLTRVVTEKKDFSAVIRKHQLRKLKAEERRLSKLIDQQRDNGSKRKLYPIIREVEQRINRLSREG